MFANLTAQVCDKDIPKIYVSEKAKAVYESKLAEAKINFENNPNAENLILEASDSLGRTAEAIMAKLPPMSLIVNSTGMGKDLPGSPIPNSSNFPDHAIVWELNYRGSLEFYRHVQDQQKKRKMRVHDGWDYFLLGWSSVMEEVFHFELTESLMLQLNQTAKPLRNE